MLQMLQDIWQIAKKDLTEFRRDHLRLLTFVLMPIFMMILTGFVFPSQNSLKDIPLGIVQADAGKTGAQLEAVVKNIGSNGTKSFKVREYSSESALRDAIKRQDVNGGLIVGGSFSADIAASRQTSVTIVQDESNPQIAALVTQILAGAAEGFGRQIGAQKIGALIARVPPGHTPAPTPAPGALLSPVTYKVSGITGDSSNYFEFVAPGIIAMVVLTAVLTGLAGAVSREREQGTLDGIMIAPISRLSVILGKALGQAIRGLAQGAIVLVIAVFLFGVVVHGNIFLLLFLLLAGIFSFVGLGILVSASAAEQETATQILFMFQFPMLFLSGAFFPIQQMPKIMQDIAHLLPLTYAIEALRKVVILGAGIAQVQNELIIMGVFGAVTLAISVPLFKRLVTQ